MKYKALTIVSFDRIYHKGESIPEEVIYPSMIAKLIRCKIISPTIENDNMMEAKKENDFGKIKKTIAKRGVNNDQDIFL